MKLVHQLQKFVRKINFHVEKHVLFEAVYKKCFTDTHGLGQRDRLKEIVNVRRAPCVPFFKIDTANQFSCSGHNMNYRYSSYPLPSLHYSFSV
jgi:hypothetical protein